MDIGLIFDMDGVIVDNNQYHYRAWKQMCDAHGKAIDENIYREQMNGRTLAELVNFIFDKEMSKEEALAVGQEKEAHYRTLYQPYLEPTKGLLPLLSDAFDEGIPMVIGTSAPKENVNFILNGLGIGHYFNAVLDDRAVSKGKPDPDIYLKCAKAINRPNNHCIVFEDAVSGLKAGKAAGSSTVALATSHRREELSADLIINHFSEFNLTEAKKLLANA
ncbi:MAG: beta-phosphoglucomutase [Cyclobacteriaceae bacterium]|jgi:beta-phosphoglucomutase